MADRTAQPGPIAIVDDEASVRTALGRLLSSVGIDYVTHASGRDFLDSRQLHEVECLVLDVHMPGLSGMEVLAEVRVAATKLAVILMTGRYDQGFADDAIAAGASVVLRKPFDETAFFAAIEEATGRPVAH